MSLKCGIVGLPNVGKSTLFNALTSANALAANYPFATKDPNVGIITVPDPRIEKLSELIHPQKKMYTTVEILDIAGLIKGASQGEGLGNQFLANIREVDAIIHVIRCFENDNIVHVDGSIDPVRDKEVIDLELILKDIDTVDKRLEKYRKLAKSGKKEDKIDAERTEELLVHLSDGQPARTFINEENSTFFNEFYLLTAKPVLYVCNVDEDSAINGNKYVESIIKAIENENAEILTICADIEAEIATLDEAERQEFIEELGLNEPGINKVIRASYELLNLITYLTAGEKEVRAWTVLRNSTAPQAAGVIHTDFEKGFIRVEVIKFDDFVKYGSEQAVKEAGKMSVEGKEYIVQDGDVMHFRFNV